MIANTLSSDIVNALRKELGYPNIVWFNMDQIILETTSDYFETQMGQLLQKIQKIIDSNFPTRDHNLFVVIRDRKKRIENKIKIWKSA